MIPAGPTVPAPLMRRYAAWSLDAAAVAVLTALALGGRWSAALDECRRALDDLTRAMAGTMQTALASDGTPLTLVQAWLTDPALHGATLTLAAALTALLLPAVLVFALVSLVWFPAFEGGAWQATPGKRVLGLRVIDDDALAPGYTRSALRQAAGLLSWLSLNFGHALAAMPPRHQALHDRIAGTRVVRTHALPFPVWARAWLAMQLPACMLLLAMLMGAVDRSLADALTG